MSETQTLYRVTYEQRAKPRCVCCEYREPEATEHAWSLKSTDPTPNLKQAERDESDVYANNDAPAHSNEVRNVRIEKAEITTWSAVNAWEESDGVR